MLTWTILKKHLLDIDLTQTWETTALRMLITVDLFYFIMYEEVQEHKFIEVAFGWEPGHVWLHTALESDGVGSVLKMAFGHSLSFGLSQYHGHGSWLVCEVAFNQWYIS